MPRPAANDHAPFYANYISVVSEDDIVSAMTNQLDEGLALLRPVAEKESLVHHSPYTWSIREVVGHLIDSERIFGYRALRIARGDTTPLPGFDENDYARAAEFDRCPLGELTQEFEFVRRSHLWLFRHLRDSDWQRRGIANNNAISVLAIAYIIVGHVRHHLGIVRKRLAGAETLRTVAEE